MGWIVGSTGHMGSRKRKLQLLTYCSTEDETGGLNLGKYREKRRSSSRMPGFLWVSRGCLLKLGDRIK